MYVDTDVNGVGVGVADALHHRHKRSLSWDDVETFYADKNNFAMYLVLPIIVLVYGGCAVIYCIARCRRYIRRKKKKPLTDQEDEPDDSMTNLTADHNDRNERSERNGIPSIPVRSNNVNHVPSIPVQQREGAQTSSDVHVSVNHDSGTPLPWQVPDEQVPPTPRAAPQATAIKTVPQVHSVPKQPQQQQNHYENRPYEQKQQQQQHTYENKAYEPEPQHRPPPSYDETYKPIRPMSRPPPYEEKGISHRKGSVEEIITLESKKPLPVSAGESNDRKRPRSGMRSLSRLSMKEEATEEERERARQLVRGDRPPRKEPVPVHVPRQRTPDIISHARAKPLQPQYVPPANNNANMNAKADAAAMARQAAQLLRLDQMERQVGKKKKRLVFVAE